MALAKVFRYETHPKECSEREFPYLSSEPSRFKRTLD